MTLKLKTRGRSLAVMLVSLLIASSVVMVGGVAAWDSETGEFSEEVAIGDDSVEVFADVHADTFDDADTADGSGTFDVTVTYTGVNSTDETLDGTELSSETVTLSSEETVSSSYELADSDVGDYEAVDVTVEVVDGGNSALVDMVEAGTLEQNVGGGGGGLLDGGLPGGTLGETGIPLLIVLGGLVVGFLYVGRDD